MNLKSYLLANTALFRWPQGIPYHYVQVVPEPSAPYDFSDGSGFDFASFRHHEHISVERIPRRR